MKSGWQTKTLGELCEVFADGDWVESKDQSPEGIRLIQTGNVGEGVFKDRAEKARYISKATFKRLRCTEIFEGDCLISRLPDPVGRSCILPDTGETMITAVDCTIVRFNRDQFLAPFFNFYSQSDDYIGEVAKQCTGTTRNRISRGNLGLISIPVPPLAEQRRIVDLLDEAFAGITTAKANAEKNLKNARAIFESHLQSVFTQRGKAWADTALGDVCGFVRGPFGGSLKKSIFVANGYAVYEQQHAIYNQFDEVRYFINEAKFKEMKRFELQPDDLIMSCSGTMGRVAIVPKDIKRGIINQALLKLTPSSKILNAFLKSWMESEAFQDALKEYSGGAAIQNVASVKILKEIKAPLPPIPEQKHIVEELNAFREETQRLTSLYERKLVLLEALKKSLLHQAFTGELTMQQPQQPIELLPLLPPIPTLSGITTTDLHAGILAIGFLAWERANRQTHFGHVFGEKFSHMAEALVGVDLGRNPVQDHFGPDDFSHLKKVEHRARMANFFTVREKAGVGYQMAKGRGFEFLITKTRAALGALNQKLHEVIRLMLPMNVQQAEIFATVYAAWNNLLINKQEPTEEQIVLAARENWHPDKLKIPRDKFFGAIKWIKDKGIVPQGKGKRVVPKPA